MKKIRFKAEKLIRDKMPNNLRNKGIIAGTKDLSHQEYLALLKEKLVEEAKEVYESKDSAELIEEIADVLEVIYTLAKAHTIDMEQIEGVRLQKYAKRGGFENKTYCTIFEMDESHPDIGYYLGKPEIYPQISE